MKNQFVRQAKLPRGAYNKTLDEAIAPYQGAPDGRMNWRALKMNICPKCSKDFVQGLQVMKFDNGDKLMTHGCGFRIRESRYKEIVASQVSAGLSKDPEEEE